MAADTLSTSGFTNCDDDSSIQVNKVDIEYDKTSQTVTFDVSGVSTEEQKVMATLNVTAYGINVYSNTFNPCDNSTYVEQLCPGKCLVVASFGAYSNKFKFLPVLSQQVEPRRSRPTMRATSRP